jgi:hypothetical protein
LIKHTGCEINNHNYRMLKFKTENQCKFNTEYYFGEVKKPKLTIMKTKVIFPFCFFLTFLFYDLGAQETTSALGGIINSAGGSISYTVGQVTNLYITEIKGSVAQGVQQPYEIFLITGIDEVKGISLNFQVYPNPVQDFLKLKIQDLNLENLIWKIFDSSGRLLNADRVSGAETLIPMTNYPSGIYLFSVIDKNNLQYKTYQIIKN